MQKYRSKNLDLKFFANCHISFMLLFIRFPSLSGNFYKIYSNKLKEWLKMTKVARLFEEEKIEAINEKLNERNFEVAKMLLEENVDMLIIMKTTGLSQAAILKLKDSSVEAQA
jgi:hypothetical protein